MHVSYRIFVCLAGETLMQLCTVESPAAVAAVLQALCAADKPEFSKIVVELVPSGLR